MASALSSAINALKYANVRAKQSGAWSVIHESWAKDTTWKEPKQIWVKNGATWEKASTEVRYIKFNGSSTYVNCGNTFNNYIDGVTTTYHEFSIVLTSIASVQTLFSYGTSTSYYIIEIDTNGRVYVKSRYNSGNALSINHATALSLNTFYLIRIEVDSDATIRVRDINDNAVGSDFTGIVSRTQLNLPEYIGMKYNSTNYFSGYLLDLNMYGGTYGGDPKRHDCNYFLSSAVGGTTVTDTYVADGSQNLTISGSVISSTG